MGDPKERTESLLTKEVKNLQENFKVKIFLALGGKKSFWTADAPVATVDTENARVFYMPMSSNCAILFTNERDSKDLRVEQCSEEDVSRLNSYMLNCRTDLLLSKHFEDTDIVQIESYLRIKN